MPWVMVTRVSHTTIFHYFSDVFDGVQEQGLGSEGSLFPLVGLGK